jgi:hypothetical protein
VMAFRLVCQARGQWRGHMSLAQSSPGTATCTSVKPGMITLTFRNHCAAALVRVAGLCMRVVVDVAFFPYTSPQSEFPALSPVSTDTVKHASVHTKAVHVRGKPIEPMQGEVPVPARAHTGVLPNVYGVSIDCFAALGEGAPEAAQQH